MKHFSQRAWFSAADLAALSLPGMPKSKRKINELAERERWAFVTDDRGMPLARPRDGRGGGLEYNVRVIPAAARTELIKRGIAPQGKPVDCADGEASHLWSWFERQSDKVKSEAARRLRSVDRIDALEGAGMTRSAAVAAVADESGIGGSTLWNWIKLVEGIARADRLPAIAPRRSGGGREARIDPEIWQIFKSDYLRPEKPALSSCYQRASEIAAARGISIPIERTFVRKLKREVDERVILLRREGAEALRQSMPAQQRSVADLHAMEWVNIDGHEFDVFVITEDGRIIRPIMIAIQDIYSRKILAWRIGEAETAVQTRLAFADLFKTFGIPKHCVLDNGRAFASKWISGGAKTRFRGKIKDEDPTGLLTALGIGIHWATPYRGQSKPIERGFRDLCETISKHPACAGAYTGRSPLHKPANYGKTAVPIARFMQLVESGIAAHNARTGRRTEIAKGRSFDQVFEESYARSPIGKATEEHLRMALLAADKKTVNRKTGQISLFGNRYWSPDLSQYHGRKIIVRFDPDNLHQDVHVYDLAGAYLCTVENIAPEGFGNAEAARRQSKLAANHRKAARKAEELEDLLAAEQIAALLPDHIDEAEPLTSQVTRPMRHRGQTAAALKRQPVNDQERINEVFKRGIAATNLRLID